MIKGIKTIFKSILSDTIIREKTDMPERLSSLFSYLSMSSDEKQSLRNSVRLLSNHGQWQTVIRMQTPDGKGFWGNTYFKYHGTGDINLGINDIKGIKQFSTFNKNNWWIHLEPQGYIKQLGYDNPALVKNFSRIYTSAPYLYERGAPFIASPPYVQWYLGKSAYNLTKKYTYIDYNYILNAGFPEKSIDLVCIASSIQDLPGHSDRINFIIKLANSGLDFQLWGSNYWKNLKQYRGVAPNKWDVYRPAKYVLVIENEQHTHYWSEKFADAILCHSMPIYYGCPNMNSYFPNGSYIPFDIKDPHAVDILHSILNGSAYENNLEKMVEARKLILEKHNFFAFFDREIQLNFDHQNS